jgi:hypothetical protein
MTVTNITNGELFTVRVYKNFGALLWANNYEFRATQDVPFAQTAIIDLVNQLTNLERPLYPNYIRLDRAVVSTYQPDSRPYNPETFTTLSINLPGTATFSSDAMPIEYCIFVRRVTASGRPGKLLYRGALQESDVGTLGLRAVISASRVNALQTQFSQWYASFLSGQIPFELVMIGGQENINVRVVQGLAVVERVVLKQFGNAYFDRTPRTGGQ